MNGSSIAAATLVAAIAIAAPATAQQRYIGVGNNVTVDLSAIGGGGGGNLPLGPGDQVISNATGGLVLFPPTTRPVSRLEGPLANRSFALTPAHSLNHSATFDAAQASGLSARPGEHTGCRTTQGRDTCAASTSAANRDSNAAGPVDTCTRTDDYSAAAASIPGSNSGPVSRRKRRRHLPAAAPATNVSLPADETRILFSPDSADLTDSAKAALDKLASSLNENDGLRIQLQAFAGGTDESAPEARRLSLKRAPQRPCTSRRP